MSALRSANGYGAVGIGADVDPRPRRRHHAGAAATGSWLALAATVGLVAGCSGGDGSDPTLPRITGGALVTAATTTTTTIPDTYVVQEGDTLSAIAERFHVDIGRLASANGITNPDDIYAGQTLAVPRAGAGATTTT